MAMKSRARDSKVVVTPSSNSPLSTFGGGIGGWIVELDILYHPEIRFAPSKEYQNIEKAERVVKGVKR